MAEVIEQLESCCAPDLPKLPRSDRGHRTTGQSLNIRSGETTVFDPSTPSGSPLSGLPTSSTTRRLPPASLQPLDKKSIADTIGQRDGNTVKMKQSKSSVPQSFAREAASTPTAHRVNPAVKESPSGSRDHGLTITPFPGPKKRRLPQVVLLGRLIGIATAVVLAGLIYWLTGNLQTTFPYLTLAQLADEGHHQKPFRCAPHRPLMLENPLSKHPLNRRCRTSGGGKLNRSNQLHTNRMSPLHRTKPSIAS